MLLLAVFQARHFVPRRAQLVVHLRQAGVERHALQPETVFDGGRAGEGLAGGDVAVEAALGGEADAVADLAMTVPAPLSGQDDVVSDLGAAGQPHLGAEQAVLAYARGVADLDEVVNLGAAADAGFADGGAVNGGAGLDFDVVFDNDRPRLRDLVVAAGVLAGEAVAVAADDGGVLQNDAMSQLTMLAHYRVRVRHEVVADAGPAVDGDETVQARAVADVNVVVNKAVRPERAVPPQSRPRRHNRGRMYPGGERRGLVEKLESARERQVGVHRAHGGQRQVFVVGRHNDGGGACLAQASPVARVGEKGELARPGRLDAGDPGDFYLPVPCEARLQPLSQFA